MDLKLSILENNFTVHRFPPNAEIPHQVYGSEFYSISKTADELSITCDASIPIKSEKNEPGWSCIKVEGPLDFSLTGILAKISTVLAQAKISIFAISTFDTDYILVPAAKVAVAKAALQKAGYSFTN